MSRHLSIDFAHPARPAALGWGLLLVGAISLVAALGLTKQWRAEHARLMTEAQARAEGQWNAARLAAQPKPLTADDRRFHAIAPQLAQPWLPTLRWIETVTQAPIYLTALDIDPVSGTVRVEGEGSSFSDALRYTEQLNSPGLLEQAQLRVHEEVKGSAPAPAVRFSATARWSQR